MSALCAILKSWRRSGSSKFLVADPKDSQSVIFTCLGFALDHFFGLAIMSSDGSVKDSHGTTGWTFATQTGVMTCDEIQCGASSIHRGAPYYRRTWDRTNWPTAAWADIFTSDIANNTAIISSDGSVKDGHGSTGWTIAIQTVVMTCNEIQRDAAPVDCDTSEQSSTRCELSGIFGRHNGDRKGYTGKSTGHYHRRL